MFNEDGYDSWSQNRPDPQAGVTAKVYPNIDKMNVAMASGSTSYFHLDGAINNPRIYDIAQDDPVFVMRGEASKATQSTQFGTVKASASVMSALNGLAMSPRADEIVRAMRASGVDERFIQLFIGSQIKFVGICGARCYTHKSQTDFRPSDFGMSIFINGVFRVKCKTDMAAFSSVKFRVPTQNQYRNSSWRVSEISDDPDQTVYKQKIIMYPEVVDQESMRRDMLACFNNYLLGDESTKSLVSALSEDSKEVVPLFLTPHIFAKCLTAFGILVMSNAVKSGTFNLADPEEIDGRVARSSQGVESAFENNGWEALNFVDALRFVQNGAGQKTFPRFGETQTNDVSTFGESRDGRGVSKEDAGNSLMVALCQLTGLSVSCDEPLNGVPSLASEGFYKNVADDQGVLATCRANVGQFFHESMVNLMSHVLSNNDRFQAYAGYNYRTKSNQHVFTVSQGMTVDTTRGAGCAAYAISEAFPSAINSLCATAHIFGAPDGVVQRAGRKRQYCQIAIATK